MEKDKSKEADKQMVRHGNGWFATVKSAPHHSPTFLVAFLPSWLDTQLKCHVSEARMQTHHTDQTETTEWTGCVAQVRMSVETKLLH